MPHKIQVVQKLSKDDSGKLCNFESTNQIVIRGCLQKMIFHMKIKYRFRHFCLKK